MPKPRTSATIVKLQVDLANLKSLDPNLDLGNDLSIEVFSTLLEEIQSEIETLNTTLNEISETKRSLREKERTLVQLKERIHLGIAAKHGKDSREYRIAKPPTAKKRKITSTEPTEPTNNPPLPIPEFSSVN